jgi:hypothetical protein
LWGKRKCEYIVVILIPLPLQATLLLFIMGVLGCRCHGKHRLDPSGIETFLYEMLNIASTRKRPETAHMGTHNAERVALASARTFSWPR